VHPMRQMDPHSRGPILQPADSGHPEGQEEALSYTCYKTCLDTSVIPWHPLEDSGNHVFRRSCRAIRLLGPKTEATAGIG